MRSTKDASSACFTGSLSLLGTRSGGAGGDPSLGGRPLGTASISTGFGTVYGAKPQAPRGKSVRIASGPPGGTLGRAADQEVLREGQQLMHGGVRLLDRIALDGARRRRGAVGRDAVVRRHPEDPEH